jgi:signal recognition particle subunit SRP54
MAAKLAGKFKSQGRKPLLVACDIYRPAAIEQLQINAGKVGVDCFSMGTNHPPVDIVKAALSHASQNGENVVIIDTAGRLHIDEEMMNELVTVKEKLSIDHTILTVDSMTGQDAVNVAEAFNNKLTVTGVILTKLDGDTRGGAALSARQVTGKPIKFVGTGEKLENLDIFHPDRMANRILGMGDVLSLIEKAEQMIDEKEAEELEKKLMQNKFDLNDLLDQFRQIRKMGSIKDMLALLPGIGNKVKDMDVDERRMDRMQAIILSMTEKERRNPAIINPSRKKRIADGCGQTIEDVNRLLSQYKQMQKMFRQLNGKKGGKHRKMKGMRLPPGFDPSQFGM